MNINNKKKQTKSEGRLLYKLAPVTIKEDFP